MKNYKFILFLLTFIVFASCGDGWMYDKKYDISNKTWTYKDTLNFDFEIKDTFKIYNLYLEVTHDEVYPYQNLYLMTKTAFPTGERPSQRINIDLATNDGVWLGKKSGKSFTHRVDLQQNAYYNRPGKYTLTLAQYMRQDSLPIESIRFGIEDTKLTRDKIQIKSGERPKEKKSNNYLPQK